MKKLNFSKMFILGVLVTMFLFPTFVNALTDVTDEASLKQALKNGETEINLKNDIVLSTDEMTHATRKVGLEVKGEGTITINGNGYTLSSPLAVAMEVRANTDKEVKVVLNDITVIGLERAIDTRSKGITLELNKTNLSVTKVGNYQALTIGGSAGTITVDINNNSVIDGGKYGYGIITFNPVNMTIDDSTVKGYAALYLKSSDGSEGSAGSVITITKSKVEGNSTSSDDTSDFGTIVFEDNNIKVNIIDSIIKATNTGKAIQTPFVISQYMNPSSNVNNVVTTSGNSEIIVDTVTESPLVGEGVSGLIDVVIKAGVKSNIEIDEEFLEEGTEIVVDEKTGEITVVSKEDNSKNETENQPNNKLENSTATDKEDIKNPNTSDKILISFIVSGLSFLGLAVFAIYYKKCYR